MMNTIYLVTPEECYWDGMLNGYATDAAGIKLLLQGHLIGYGTMTIWVDLKTMTARATDEFGCNHSFRIRELKEVTC